MKTVYIIFSTNDIGGSERRFTGLWESLMNTNNSELDTKLVVSPSLWNKLQESACICEDKNIVVTNFSGRNFIDYRNNIKKFVYTTTSPGDILHFIGVSPLARYKKRKVVFSLTNTRLNIEGWKNKVVILVSTLFADAVDILDPKIYKQLKKFLFWKRGTISQTSNSFCNTKVFTPVPFNQKKDWLVFLGRFDYVKQIEEFMAALPEIHDKIKMKVQNDYRFWILGYGQLEKKIKDKLKESIYEGIPVIVQFEKQPEEVLNQSKIFFSLQLHNNYPSKSLLEAMAAGNIPLVTDVGQTRWIAKPKFSYYVQEHFAPTEIAEAASRIFDMTPVEWQEKMTAARQLVVQEHTIENMREYYRSIYEKL